MSESPPGFRVDDDSELNSLIVQNTEHRKRLHEVVATSRIIRAEARRLCAHARQSQENVRQAKSAIPSIEQVRLPDGNA